MDPVSLVSVNESIFLRNDASFNCLYLLYDNREFIERFQRLSPLYNLTLTEFKPSSTDAPTEAPQWPRCLLPAGVSDRFSPAYLQLDYVETDPRDDISQGVTLSPGRWDCSVTHARLE